MTSHMKCFKTPGRFIVLSVCFLCFSCGGGGGGNDVDDEVSYLDTYAFSVNLDSDDLFRIETITGEGSEVRVVFSALPGFPEGFKGNITLDEVDDEVSLSSLAVDDSTIFRATVYVYPEETPFVLDIDVNETINLENGEDPVTGGFTVSGMDNDADGDTDADDVVHVSFRQDAGATVVDLQLGSYPEVTYYLDEFMDLTAGLDADPSWQEQAAAACASLEMLSYEVTFVADTIMKIESEDLGTVLGDSNAGLADFDDYFVPDPTGGSSAFTCESETVGHGADFLLSCDRYWKDDPDDNIDTLIDGSVRFENYFFTVTDMVLTEVGFDFSDGAGIYYGDEGLAYYETNQAGSSGTPVDDLWWTRTLHGSYRLMFLQPDN